MAFVLMVEADFENFNLVSQNDADLDKETGEFSNEKWDFITEVITTDGTEFRREYSDGVNSIFLISNKTAVVDGDSYSAHAFYKEI